MDRQKLLDNYINLEIKNLSRLDQNLGIQDNVITSFKDYALHLGLMKVSLDYPLTESKFEFNKALLCYDFELSRNKNLWIPLFKLMLLTLSDNNLLINKFFFSLPLELYKDKNGTIGEIQAFKQIVLGDFEGLKDTFVYLRNLKDDYHHLFKPEFHFPLYEGFIRRDPSAIAFAIDSFQSDEYKKELVKYIPEEAFLPFTSIAYLKQAWKHGIKAFEYKDSSKISYDSIPEDWVSFNPLTEYTIPYSFLRDYYREQGVNWRYDPVYPELQNWTNDPENPGNGGFSQ